MKNSIQFREQVYARLYELAEEALAERKKHVAAIYFSEKIDDQEEDLQILKQGDDCDAKDDEGEPIEKKKVTDKG